MVDMYIQCRACGTESITGKNGISICPHCDRDSHDGNACHRKNPTCVLLNKWEGSGPRSG